MLFNWLKSITDIYTPELTTFVDITCINIQGMTFESCDRQNSDEKKK